MIALIQAYRDGFLARQYWPRNLVAGLIVAVVALPLSMAFAMGTGVAPEQGLYTAIVAGLIVSVFGGSPVQIAGPTGAFIAILAGITLKYGFDGLQMATFMAGLILVGMGLLRLGGAIKFIPEPVIVGFTTGIALVIFVGQWQDFFGLPKASGLHFHDKLWQLLQSFSALSWHTTGMGLVGLLLVTQGYRIPGCRRIPGPLLALLGATVLQAVWGFPDVATIGSRFGGIPSTLPTWHWPQWSVSEMLLLVGPAFAVAMLGAIESLLSAVVADGMAGTKHQSNQELIGQGLANMVVPFFGGFAATGAIARTATSIRHGGNSPLAGIIHVVFLMLIIVLAAPLASYVPLTALSAILFVVAWNMSDLRHFVYLLKHAPRGDVVVLVVTFLLTVFVDLVVAVNIGVLLSVLLFMGQMAKAVRIRAVESDAPTSSHLARPSNRRHLVFDIQGPFFFAAVEELQHVLNVIHENPQSIALCFDKVPFVDITAIERLKEAITSIQKHGIAVHLVGMRPAVRNKLKRAGTFKLVLESQHHADLEQYYKTKGS